MTILRAILADDHPEVRSALRLLLGEKPGVSVVDEASTSYDLLWQVKSGCADLVLLDWELPGTKPADLIKVLLSLCPNLLIIALSSHPQMRQAALDGGASDFVCKSDPPEYILTALDKCLPMPKTP